MSLAQRQQYWKDVSQSISKFYVQSRHCDVILSASVLHDDNCVDAAAGASDNLMFNIPCHKLILSANSQFFDDLFHSTSSLSGQKRAHVEEIEIGNGEDDENNNLMVMLEEHGVKIDKGLPGDTPRIILTKHDIKSVATMVEFAYNGQAEIKMQHIPTLLRHAEQFKFGALVKYCKSLLFGQEIDASNCVSVFFLAQQMELPDEKRRAFKVLLANFQEAVAECEQLFVEKCPEDVLRKLLASDHLQVQNETEVYRVLMKWVEQDVQSRGAAGADSCFPHLFHLLRIACMPNEFLLDVVMDNDLVLSHKSCISLTRSAIRFHLGYQGAMTGGDRRSSGLGSSTNSLLDAKEESGGSIKKNNLETYHTMPRNSCHTFVVFSNDDNIERFSTFSNKWQHWQSKNLWDGFSVLNIDGKIYLFHVDKSTDVYEAKLEMYDPVCGSWESLTAMPTCRVWFALCLVDSKYVYTIGGYNSEGVYVNTVEMLEYQYEQRKWAEWRMMQPMKSTRSGSAAASIANKIYVAGGCNAKCLATVEVLDRSVNKWTKCASMKHARQGMRMQSFDEKLFVFGGYNEDYLNTCEKYDPVTDVWTFLSNMQVPRYSFGLGLLADKFYIVGGDGGGSSVEVYDPLLNEWTCGPDKLFSTGMCTQLLVVRNDLTSL